jgi:hypothetical protein
MGTVTELRGAITEIDAAGTAAVESLVGTVHGIPAADARPGDAVVAVFRPESPILYDDQPAAAPNVWRCMVKHKMFMGAFLEIIVDVLAPDGHTIEATVTAPRGSGFREGSEVWMQVPVQALRILAADQ